MADEHELKIHEGPRPHRDFETAVIKGVEYVRDPEGTWRYADSWVKVPGARDMTLTERFLPKFVISSAKEEPGRIERVVVSGQDLENHPELLGWAAQLGFPVHGPAEEVFEVMVPWEVWQDHDRIPGEMYAPELHGSDAERELAEAEREYREADRNLEAAAAKRAEVLRRHSEDMTRQQARAITDLSVGRIQQLIREGVSGLDEEDVMLLATVEAHRPRNIRLLFERASEVFDFRESLTGFRRRVQSLQERGLVARTPKEIRITPEGKEVLVSKQQDLLESGDD